MYFVEPNALNRTGLADKLRLGSLELAECTAARF